MTPHAASGATTLADVAVVGAGIVGTCIAYALRKAGLDVALLDRDSPGRGCSFGNSGAISPGSVAPLAMPGVLASVPRMLRDVDGPLYLAPRYLPHALPWLIRFAASARPGVVARTADRLAELHRDAVSRHVALAQEVGVPDIVLRRGHLYLYPDDAAASKDDASWRLRALHGYEFQRLDREGIVALEPHAPARYRAGVFLADHASVVNPYRYVEAIARAFEARGGRIERGQVRTLQPQADGWRIERDGDVRAARCVVVAAGAWSRSLLDPLGVRVAVESQRGYHVQFRGLPPVTRTVVLADRKVFLTPMEEGLRVGGTVEIAGLAAPPSAVRSAALVRIAKEAFGDLLDATRATTWMGHRPCMPDSVPVVGPAPGHRGLFIATGHGHLGLTDAPAAAERICSLVATA